MITGLGHIGIYLRDLEKMVGFYRDFLGLKVTKQNWRAGGGVPERRPRSRCEALDDVRQFHRRLVAGGYRIQRVVNHASAIGCYFYDPEGNCAEVFWVTGRPSWVPVSMPIDLEQTDEAILAEVDKLWQRVRDIGVGERMPEEPPTLQF